MASRAMTGGGLALPLDLALSVIPSLPRPLLARFVARAIERLDTLDSDPDLELNGDEHDGTLAEDEECDFPNCGRWDAGCPFSDPGEEDDPPGGSADDEGEAYVATRSTPRLTYAEDQRIVLGRFGLTRWRDE